MNIWSFIAAIAAAGCFLIDFFSLRGEPVTRGGRWGSLVSLGLFFFVLAFVLQLVVTTTSPIRT